MVSETPLLGILSNVFFGHVCWSFYTATAVLHVLNPPPSWEDNAPVEGWWQLFDIALQGLRVTSAAQYLGHPRGLTSWHAINKLRHGPSWTTSRSGENVAWVFRIGPSKTTGTTDSQTFSNAIRVPDVILGDLVIWWIAPWNGRNLSIWIGSSLLRVDIKIKLNDHNNPPNQDVLPFTKIFIRRKDVNLSWNFGNAEAVKNIIYVCSTQHTSCFRKRCKRVCLPWSISVNRSWHCQPTGCMGSTTTT